eukprot:TRINITY_DN14825_c0_g1::TRINITY_DN14825_c0_g1_i1::g.30160::m.30160 TRINITY_DN14825_c0_g1::TRINITY_DN14825_c0_g1_i1::g.30160  ORF type:complete len:134 (+),score=36.88,DUF1138/PF06592.8/0.00089 TRINITY_DN14825_c0_g1_i1:47-403(+)
MAPSSSIPFIGAAPKVDYKVWHSGSACLKRAGAETAILFGLSGVLFTYLYAGRNVPRTITPEWEKATRDREVAWPRQHSPHPTMRHPISRIRDDPKLDFVWKAAAMIDKLEAEKKMNK